MDFSKFLIADEIDMYNNASGTIGMGAICESAWMYQLWSPPFIKKFKPNIEYLELYAVVAAVLTLIHKFKNKRIILFCECGRHDKSDINLLQELHGTY